MFKFEQAEEETCSHDVDEDWTKHFSNATLMAYLDHHTTQQIAEKRTIDLVDDFIKTRKSMFKDITASQWGTIRGIAMSADHDKDIIGFIDTYTQKGVAKDNWEERGRRKILIKFLEDNKSIVSVRELVINLSSEMAKETNR